MKDMVVSMRLQGTLGAVEGRLVALGTQVAAGASAGQLAGSLDAQVDGASSPGPAKEAKAHSHMPVKQGPPPPRSSSAHGRRPASAGLAGQSGLAVSPRAGSADRRTVEMTSVWVGGLLSALTRVAFKRWTTAAAQPRVGLLLGEDDIKSRGIGNSCTVVLPILDGVVAVVRCFRDVPPRWTTLPGSRMSYALAAA